MTTDPHHPDHAPIEVNENLNKISIMIQGDKPEHIPNRALDLFFPSCCHCEGYETKD